MNNLSVSFISFIFLFFFRIVLFCFGLIFLSRENVMFFDFELLTINSSIYVITILIDWISLIFMSFVGLISSLVIFYSLEYIESDKTLNRFIILVLIFVFSIILLIISPNLISILLGWDGLGLVSYCLVIYFQNVKSYNAGILTALSNRIGDVFILLSIAWIINLGSWNYIFYLELETFKIEMQIIGLLVIIAAITKRAQIPYSAWLPAAMAAPTPVSALVHSSTLVTAGVYLLIRFNHLIIISLFSQILLLLGGLTIFIAGLGANFEYDLKKIIALSTLRQLGLIIRILCIGAPILAFFHLLTHALFKALLFICAGVIIHSIKNFQDIRYMGALIFQLPMTAAYLNIANLALCGMPFLAGFYSKDLILEIRSFFCVNLVRYFLYYFSTGLTVCYSVRLIYYLLYSNFSSWAYSSLFDSSKIITFRISGLIVISIIGGSALSWLVFPVPCVIILPKLLKLIVLFVCLSGGAVGFYLSNWSLYIISKLVNKNYVFYVGSMWALPLLSTNSLIYYPLLIGNLFIKSIDHGWLESFGAQNLNKYTVKRSKFFSILQFNNLKVYLIYFFLWLLIFLFLLI